MKQTPKRNYDRELEQIITENQSAGTVPSLLLHSCCAPCSSYVLEYLCQFFQITVFYYNPNISSKEEYVHRKEEQKRLIQAYNEEKKGYPISYIEGRYEKEKYTQVICGLEREKEGGARCRRCFELRLEETAKLAAGQFDYFATTLTISPLKNAVLMNAIGEALALKYPVKWLPSDFKKKNGYLRSIELSKIYQLYRQNYCGCIFSKKERELS